MEKKQTSFSFISLARNVLKIRFSWPCACSLNCKPLKRKNPPKGGFFVTSSFRANVL
jgi:hypothetical protein